MMPIPRRYFEQDALTVAQGLLGARLVHQTEAGIISGRIVETEAYSGVKDAASHAHRGKTPRNAPMWGTGGMSYAYLIYGRYWLLNVTCEPVGVPGAVLFRALEPLTGLDQIHQNRAPILPKNWTNGPGRLTLALGIAGDHNQRDMTTTASHLWLEAAAPLASDQISVGGRIGMGTSMPQAWRDAPRRFWITDNPHISKG